MCGQSPLWTLKKHSRHSLILFINLSMHEYAFNAQKISQFSFNSAEAGDYGLDKGLGHRSCGKHAINC